MHLEVDIRRLELDSGEPATPLVPFHGFEAAIKSLRAVIPTLPSSQIFNLVFSFPLLEDLVVMTFYYGIWTDNGDSSEEDEMPMSPPRFTGSLELYPRGGTKPITR